MSKPDNGKSRFWIAAGGLLVAVLLALAWWSRNQPAAPAVTASEWVLAGQAYGPELVLLQQPTEGSAVSKPWPPRVELSALHGAGASRLPAVAAARWLAVLPPIRPQRMAQQEAAGFSRCPEETPVGATAPSPQPDPVQHETLSDWFDPGAPGHCETDDGLAHYAGVVGLSAGMPVLAHAGFGVLKADYAEAGRQRPLSGDEGAVEEAYVGRWREQFRATYGKPFDAKENPTGPIRTLADAKLLLLMRDTQGRVVLRVSLWDRISVGQHLTRVLVVDRMNGEKVARKWIFARALGALG